MDTKILEEIGLTPGEAKVYLALLKIGQSSTGAITKESQVSRSKLYIILDKLTKKGLVGSLIRGKVAYFSAIEPKRIINYLEEKTKHFNQQKEIIQKILPELKQRARKQQTEAILYLGFKAIKNFYLNILDELSPRSTYYVIGATYGENKPGVKEFFENYHKQRAKTEIKFLPEYLVSNMTIVFYKNKSFIFFLSEEPVGFLVENEEIAKGFKSYFDAFWRIAKK